VKSTGVELPQLFPASPSSPRAYSTRQYATAYRRPLSCRPPWCRRPRRPPSAAGIDPAAAVHLLLAPRYKPTRGHCKTVSTISTGAVNGSHLLKISGYSCTKELLQNGKCAKSVSSNIGGRSWFIRYYPNGRQKEDYDYISVYLDLESADEKEVRAKFTFILLDNDGV
ncbi:hypothetical protein EJB05_56515, partial [Eragrostis curvula]